MKNKIIAFDLGGSSIKYSTNQLKDFQIEKIENINKDLVIDFISSISNKEQATEICISSPSIIDSEIGKISGISAIKNWNSENIFDEIKQKLNNKNTKIYIENDGNCSLLGNIEMINKKVNSAISIVVGTGIGGALYIDGKIVKGANNSSGEIGMVTSLDSQKQASLLFSIFSLIKNVSKVLNREVTGEEVFELFEKKNEKVYEIIDKWIYGLSIFTFNLIWIIDPEYVVIGGAVSINKTFQKIFLENISKVYKKVSDDISELLKTKKTFELTAKIVFSEKGNQSNILGALTLSPNYKRNKNN